MKGSRAHGCAHREKAIRTLAGGLRVLGRQPHRAMPQTPQREAGAGRAGAGGVRAPAAPSIVGAGWLAGHPLPLRVPLGRRPAWGAADRPSDPQVPVPAATTSVAACPLLCSWQRAGSVVGMEPCLECAQDQRFQTSKSG